MLDELVVRNLGVIEEARIEPGTGLVVVTGETGTGKTLLLGALRLLIGAEPRIEAVGPFAEEITVEGRFVVDEEETVVGRRVPRVGRSRAYLDGSLASMKSVAERAEAWVEIVGQHDQLSLTRSGEVRAMVDGALDSEGKDVLDRYRLAWNKLSSLRLDQEIVGGDRRGLARELDLVSFQAEEIRAAGFVAGEEVELERRAGRLRNADTIAQHLASARRAMDSLHDELGVAQDEINRAAKLDPSLDPLLAQLQTVSEQFTEAAREARLASEAVVYDPVELGTTESRLNLLGELRRKYGRTVEEILRFAQEATERRDQLIGLLDRADHLENEIVLAEREVTAAGNELMIVRESTGSQLASRAIDHLVDLGFTDPVLEVVVEPDLPGPNGADHVRLRFASDSRLQPGEVAKVASGGELSRLVLSLRLAAGPPDARILAFDEIDTGIGGATALALGRKLASLGDEHQVLCVTHLPQIAAFADSHFVVERTGQRAAVRRVDGEERRAELARMLAGLPESERGRQAAGELLALAGER